MESQQAKLSKGTLRAEHIGGIDKTVVEFTPGVTILVGRNATNRTSLLQAMMAALGSDNVTIKGDVDEAKVELELGDETHTRQLRRQGQNIVTEGKPYLDDATLADLFAFLLESNEARRAVTTNDDLHDLIMRPIDTKTIENEIDQLVQERKSVKQKLDEIEDLKGKLPGLEQQKRSLQEEIRETKSELEAKEEGLEEADVEETRREKSELEDKLAELRSRRNDLDDVRYDLETERDSLTALKQERQELNEELSGLPEASVGKIEEIVSEINRLRERKQELESEVNELQSVIGFNEEMLEDGGSGALEGTSDASDGSLTDELLPDEEVACWTCGSEVERNQIESTVDQLRQLSQTKMGDINDLADEIGELKTRKQNFEESKRERDRIERRLSQIETEIGESEANIKELKAERDDLTGEIKSIEAKVEQMEDETYSKIMDLHKEANQLEYEIGKLENDLEDVEKEISDIEQRLEQRDDIESHLQEIKDKITDRRTRIDQIEQTAVEEFNEHMKTVLEILNYENLDRIWIERIEREVQEGRKRVSKKVFELHVIRKSSSGAAYEDTVDHLSESEREVTGIVFALAGYLSHEVYEEVPLMMLDSLEAIDADRIGTLVDYLSDYIGYLLVALLPEDASTLPDEHERIAEI